MTMPSWFRRDKSGKNCYQFFDFMNFRGLYTALVTPFCGGKLDEEAFRKLIEFQIQGGVDGIVPVGTTGESPVLSVDEHLRVIELAVKYADDRVHVVAGSGANSTEEAIKLTQAAERLGATGSLQVCPYYNRPSQEGIYRHYKAIAEATALPLMLYNIPGRCGVEIAVDTVAKLAKDCPNIRAIKEAGGDVDRINQLVQAVPEGFGILSGDDALTLPFMSCGACGLVSVASNLIPSEMKAIVDACSSYDYAEALNLQKKYYPLLKCLMSIDRNPVPIKAALALKGMMGGEIKLPMVELSEGNKAVVADMMRQYGII